MQSLILILVTKNADDNILERANGYLLLAKLHIFEKKKPANSWGPRILELAYMKHWNKHKQQDLIVVNIIHDWVIFGFKSQNFKSVSPNTWGQISVIFGRFWGP